MKGDVVTLSLAHLSLQSPVMNPDHRIFHAVGYSKGTGLLLSASNRCKGCWGFGFLVVFFFSFNLCFTSIGEYRQKGVPRQAV